MNRLWSAALIQPATIPPLPAMSLTSQHWGRTTTDPRYPEMRGVWEIYAFVGGEPVSRVGWFDNGRCWINCATWNSKVMPKTGATNSSIAGDRYNAVAATPAVKA